MIPARPELSESVQLVNSPPSGPDEPENGVENVLLNAGCLQQGFRCLWPSGASSSANAGERIEIVV